MAWSEPKSETISGPSFLRPNRHPMQDYARTLQGHLQGGAGRAHRPDLDGSERVEVQHISEAIGYRNLDRGDWAERGL